MMPAIGMLPVPLIWTLSSSDVVVVRRVAVRVAVGDRDRPHSRAVGEREDGRTHTTADVAVGATRVVRVLLCDADARAESGRVRGDDEKAGRVVADQPTLEDDRVGRDAGLEDVPGLSTIAGSCSSKCHVPLLS
jgi:hypothetical protein